MFNAYSRPIDFAFYEIGMRALPALPLCRFAALPLCRFAALPLCRFAALPLCLQEDERPQKMPRRTIVPHIDIGE
jgi:hypothetical protein